jgi:tetratricopeptide (TPR) repeat protein
MSRSIVISICVLTLLLLPGCGRQNSGDRDVDVGIRLLKQRRFREAIAPLKKGLNKPLEFYSRSNVLTTIGNCYNQLNKFEESLEYHEQAIEEDPNNHKAYVNIGIVYRLMGDYDKAAQSYSKAMELAPDYAELHSSMGVLAMFQDDVNTAIKHFERAIELDDTLAVAHANLSIAYATAHRFEEADEEFKKAVLRGYYQPEVVKERIEQLRKIYHNNK